MQGTSAAFDAAIKKPHRAVYGAELIQDSKVTAHLEVHSGSVTADRTAAQMRSFEVEIIDRHGTLSPTDMTSSLAPFGNRMQLYRGVRLSSVQTQSANYGNGNTWLPATSTGVMNSVKVDANGNLTLGP